MSWVLLTLLTAVVFFGIVFAASGSVSAFFANPARVALFISGAIMFVIALFSQGNVSSGVREDRGNRWVLPAFALLGIALCSLSPYTERIGFWTIDGDFVRWLGVVLFTIGGAFRLWPVFVLGRRFSGLVAIQPGHTLVTTGIYKYIRHPSYLGLLMNSLGWALTFRSLVGVIVTALILIPLIGRIRAEEKFLHEQFGEEYDAYRAQTRWRLIPGVY